jgi:predicted ATPase/DNA-binding SARP family transcriptional activator
VLVRLALEVDRRVSVGALELATWADDPPATARHTIATHVLRLRRTGLVISTVQDGYRLQTPCDVAEFERLVAAGRDSATVDARLASSLFRDALSHWRSSPFPELDHVAEAAIERARLEDLAEGIKEDLLAADLDDAHPSDLIGTARQLAAEQPYRERRWELLMLVLYKAGRQAESLDVYAEARRRLVDDLGLEPGPALRRMQHAVLAQDPALDPPGGRRDPDRVWRAGVPGTSTRLIGRARERRELEAVWDRARLATLVGPPGVGKTRLALETAHTAGLSVWYVSLGQIPAEQSVAAAVLDVVAPTSRAAEARRGVLDALATEAGLLVLDGCERRLQEVVAEVQALTQACPAVRVLSTSRERLGLLDEALIPVDPLPAGDALELLVDRARLADPAFVLASEEVGSADRLCALVDRLPLGLELVARHLRLLGVREVVERVEADLGRWAGQAAGGRAGLWAALDASVANLASFERNALVALAVMVADAEISLLAQVTGPDHSERDVFDAVGRLVDASLVQVRSGAGTSRYELLRTVTIHTLETTPAAVVAAAQGRYRDAVLAAARELAGRLTSADRSATLRRLDREAPHIRAVFGALCAPPVEAAGAAAGLETAVALSDYWLGRHPAEGLEWLGRLIDAAAPEPALRAEAQLRRAHFAYWLTDFETGTAIAEDARTTFAQLGDALGEGRALRRLGAIAAATDDVSAAERLLEASLARLTEAGVDAEIGITLLHLGSLLADEGAIETARSLLERALAIAAAGGDPLAKGHALAALTLVHWKAGDLTPAMRSGGQALKLFRQLGHRPSEGNVAYRLAAVARGLDRPRAARRFARIAMEAGQQSGTRTIVALAHVNLARLDLDAGGCRVAADHLYLALDLIKPVADRWVLVDILEAVARLMVAVERPGAGDVLDSATAIRAQIDQPASPTETVDMEGTRARMLQLGEQSVHQVSNRGTDAGAVHAGAVEIVRAIARSLASAGTEPST